MAKLNQPIPTQKFELIRNRIANILIDEITNQITLQYSDLFAMGVFIERFPNYDLTDLPVINVSLARGTFDNEDIRQQDGTYTFYVDAFMKFASVQNQDGSFTDGSSLAAIKVHRAIAFCRAVLINQAYKTLGFAPPFLNSRTVSEFNIANPDREDMENTIMARITVTVVAPETSELAEARLLDGYDTQVILGDTQLGYVFSGDRSPVPPPTCAPATYRVQYVNGTLIEEGEIPSGASKTIDVPNPIVCAVAEYEVLDNDDNLLYSGSIASGGNEQITIFNSTIKINKSDGSLISSLSVLAQSTTGYNVADSTITNDPTSPTYTQNVKATEGLILPPQNILINTVNEGLINSVGDIEIVTNTPPSSIDLTGRKVTLDFPPCAPATYRVQYVNGTLIEEGEIPSGGSKTIDVPNPIVCAVAEYEVLDSDDNLLYSGSIASGGNEQITILNSTIKINKSDGSLITSLSVLAQSTTGYNVADSTITNDPTSPTYTQPLKATENLVLPPQNILVNTVNEGVINSVGDIEIVTNTPPDSVDVTGRIITLDFPPPTCDPATWTLKDSLNVTISTGSINSGASADIPAPNGTVNIRKSDNSLIEAKPVVSNGVADANVADSTITNDPTSPTYTQNVKATEGLILPPQNILVNTVNEGVIASVGDIEINTNVTPATIDVTGRKVTLDFPPSEFDVNLVDRFGNDLGTKKVSANANWDLRTLTPFDWADLYLIRLTNPPSGVQEAAVFQFYEDMIDIGAYQKAYQLGLIIGGNATDHKWNGRYPFDNESSPILQFLGSPTHDSNGISTNGTSQLILTGIAPHNLPSNNKQISIYRRNQDNAFSEGKIFGAGDSNLFRMQLSPWVTGDKARYSWDMDTTQANETTGAATTDGLQTLRILAFDSRKYDRNASNIFHQTTDFSTARKVDRNIVIGGVYSSTGAVIQALPVDCSYIYIGEALSDSQEADHYQAVQALQTALSRNI